MTEIEEKVDWILQEKRNYSHGKPNGNMKLAILSLIGKTDTVTESPAAMAGSTDPASITDDVAKKIIAARDALIRDDKDEAYHQLYSIADPEFSNTNPWEKLEGL